NGHAMDKSIPRIARTSKRVQTASRQDLANFESALGRVVLTLASGLPMPGSALEHLPTVPVEVTRLGSPGGMLRLADRFPVEGKERLLEAGRAVRLIRDEQDALRDGERPEVERLVVEHAEGQAVVLGLGAAGLVPSDVGSLQGDRHRAEPHVEPAD